MTQKPALKEGKIDERPWVIELNLPAGKALALVRTKTNIAPTGVMCAMFFSSQELAEHTIEQMQLLDAMPARMSSPLVPRGLVNSGICYGCLDYVAGMNISIFSLHQFAKQLDELVASGKLSSEYETP